MCSSSVRFLFTQSANGVLLCLYLQDSSGNACFWTTKKRKFHRVHFIKRKRFLSNVFKTMKRQCAVLHLDKKCNLFQSLNLKACSSIHFLLMAFNLVLGFWACIYFWKPMSIVSGVIKEKVQLMLELTSYKWAKYFSQAHSILVFTLLSSRFTCSHAQLYIKINTCSKSYSCVT